MTKEVFNGARHDYTFRIPDKEAIRRIYECLVKTNPELRERDIYRSKYSREYEASYLRSDGEKVRISVGIPNLKRYFGAFILAFEENGIRIVRRLKKKPKKNPLDFD